MTEFLSTFTERMTTPSGLVIWRCGVCAALTADLRDHAKWHKL